LSPSNLLPRERADDQALASAVPALTPTAHLLWTAVVDIDERESLGLSAYGERFIVPILGGHFWGGPGNEALCGLVRPGGADRQLLRRDGVKELHAVYEMQTQDGAVLGIDNQALIDDADKPTRYALSRLRVAAPEGPHAWLNRRLIVGTVQALKPARDAVLIRAYLMTT
jgi:hypothetical protein